MDGEEYNNGVDAIVASVLLIVLRRASLFRSKRLTPDEWVQFLGSVWPVVHDARENASGVARGFYDSERRRVLGLKEFPLNLQPSSFERFVQNMEPARVEFSKARASHGASMTVGSLVSREIQDAARGQIITSVKKDRPLDNIVSRQEQDHPEKHSVDMAKFLEQAGRSDFKPSDVSTIDPADRMVRGWARVATGAETCAWCLMLISRGPVYLTAGSAGSRFTDDTALRMDAVGTLLDAKIKQWHPNCDCKVVPVFKISEWEGRHAWKAAEEAWIAATDDAIELGNREPHRVHKRGKNKGKPFTLGEDTINILRQRLMRGDVSMRKISGIAG